VSVVLGPFTFDLWGPYPITLAGKSTLILTQTAFFNFDTSDVVAGPCDALSSVIPVINVTVGSRNQETKTFEAPVRCWTPAGSTPRFAPALRRESPGNNWQSRAKRTKYRTKSPGKGRSDPPLAFHHVLANGHAGASPVLTARSARASTLFPKYDLDEAQ
jgi:hypothetical protein